MKLLKAAEILQSYLDEQYIFPNSGLANSLKLGIEALERIDHARSFHHYWVSMPLPHETKE